MVSIPTTVNGTAVEINATGPEAAVDVLREQLGLTGTKLVCAGGVCGACTIQIDETPVAGCLTPATSLRNADVTTIEGLADGDQLHPLQQSFWDEHGLQCGYCTPGMIMAAADLLAHDSNPDEATVREALKGNVCRCTGDHNIVKAVQAAAGGER